MRSISLLRRNALLLFLFSICLVACNQAAVAQAAKTLTTSTGKTVTGTVVNASTGEPVVGASVRVKGSKTAGGSTNALGEYKLTVPAKATTLVISSVGFKEMEVPADAPGIIKLVSTDQTLNDVVVVGYGTQKKATLTGAVSVVSSKTMENRGPLANPLAALQGQAPGVIVTRTSGQPGRENWNFQIRGVSSTNPADPLIVLDGVPLQDNGELNTLNPADIDNISFLKDASAAIYGSRAANGVVLITTKKAKGNKFTIQYDGSVSRKITALMPKLLNVRQWGQGLMQAKTNDNYGVTPAATDLWYEIGVFAANPPDSGYIDITKLPGYAGSANGL
ncbi:MAG TPA: TonB-dependent receptor plug domain-containing protein, partial [Chitinophagaceae bacterium]|nr:TonB-dependent receptor plug domain-containing protein [Chitinophagaceae bacterium]